MYIIQGKRHSFSDFLISEDTLFSLYKQLLKYIKYFMYKV